MVVFGNHTMRIRISSIAVLGSFPAWFCHTIKKGAAKTNPDGIGICLRRSFFYRVTKLAPNPDHCLGHGGKDGLRELLGAEHVRVPSTRAVADEALE
jgi:hypothetical protein